MERYHFVTDIQVDASRERAWGVLSDPSLWPSWWRWLREVEVIDEGDQDGVGARHRFRFGTALPYTLSFETETIRAVRPSLVETRAHGELAGCGLWELSEAQPGTCVRYTWIVDTTKRWMNLLAPVARPAFSWNHDVLMRDFARGFSGAAGASLMSVHNRTVRRGSPGFGRLPGFPSAS